MTILSTLFGFTAGYRERRRRLRTYMTVASLPAEIRKDIGWGGVDHRHDTRHTRPRKPRG